jgi:hypothetical protein
VDIKLGNKYPSTALSNLAPHPFVFEEVECASMEGFLQGLKFKDPEMQKHICTLAGVKAKKSGAKKNWQRTQTLWWKGQPIPRDSQEYQDLLDRAYWALYTQNSKARAALLATRDATLTHSIGRSKASETVLTKTEFISRLHEIRRHLQTEDFVEY